MTTRLLCSSLLAASLLGFATTGRAQNLVYFGGPVISHVKLVQVAWGSSVDSDAKARLTGFLTYLVQSPYLDWLEEYDTHLNGQDGQPGSNQVIGRGSFIGAFTITPANTSTSLADSDIQVELAAQIAAGNLPAPDVDSNGWVDTLYLIDFPPGVTITLMGTAQSCQAGGFCAYHEAWTAPAGSLKYSGKVVPYVVVPDFSAASPCATACGSAMAAFDNLTSTCSQEIANAITDYEGVLGTGFMRPSAWEDSTSGPIGYLCMQQQASLGSYVFRKLRSNSQNACVVTVNVPICTGSNAPCRLCNPADDFPDGGCPIATQFCEATPGSKLEGRCVECTDGLQCSVSTPICDAMTDTCRICIPTDCTGMTPVCETTGTRAGSCVPCNATSTVGCPSATPRCDTVTDTCVQCLNGSDCPPATPICDTTHTCHPASTSGGTTGGGTTGGSSSGGSTGGGGTSGGSTGGTGKKSGCATGGAELAFPWLLALLAAAHRKNRRATLI